MTITTISSREFNHDAGAAKKATANGPVFITNRGKLAHVLLSIEEYQQLAGKQANIVDQLAMFDDPNTDFEPPSLGDDVYRPASLD